MPGTYDLELGGITDRLWLFAPIVVGGVVLVYLVCKRFWAKLKSLWDHAKQGGAILAKPRDYVLKVLLPSLGSWIAKSS